MSTYVLIRVPTLDDKQKEQVFLHIGRLEAWVTNNQGSSTYMRDGSSIEVTVDGATIILLDGELSRP